MSLVDEKRSAGASYIFTFYQQILSLTNSYANYLNLMLEFEHKYPGGSSEKASEAEKQYISQWIQTVRLDAHKSYVQYKTLTPHLKIKFDQKIDEKYKEIANKYVMDRDNLREFVMSMNEVLVSGIIQEILASNEQFLSDIYHDTPPTDRP